MRALLMILLVDLLLLAILAVSSATNHAQPSGEVLRSSNKILMSRWRPIGDINATHIRQVAEFAVDEHNKSIAGAAAAKLKICMVKSGDYQINVGVKYRLVVAASGGNGEGIALYMAKVWEMASEDFKLLLSFELINS